MNNYRPLLPDERIRIAILFQAPSLWTAIVSVYEALKSDPRYELKIFLVERPDLTYSAQSNCRYFNSEYIKYSFDKLIDFAPHAVLLQTPYDYRNRFPDAYSLKIKSAGIRVVYIPYGIEIVDTVSSRYDHFRAPVINNAYRIYVMSEAFAREYKKYCGNYSAVRVTGHPRFDILFQKERYRPLSEVQKKSNGRKVIVWHTHFPKKSFIDGENRLITPRLDEYIALAEHLSDYSEFFFVFQPHPKFGRDISTDEFKEKTDRIFHCIESAENAYIDYSDDYHAAMLSAGAYITDRSSLMIEAAAYNIPILFLKNLDYEEKIFPPLADLVDTYSQGTSYKDIVSFIEQFEKFGDAGRERRNHEFRKVIPYIDGNCGKRISDDLHFSIRNELFDLQEVDKLKLVLFGAGFICENILREFSFPEYCEIIAVIDNDSRKCGSKVSGYNILSPSSLGELSFDKIIIMITEVASEHVYKQLRFDLEIPECKIEYCEYLSLL